MQQISSSQEADVVLSPLSTQIVGSYSKPDWLCHKQKTLSVEGGWWRPDDDVLRGAKEDAALLALYEQERAGLDIVTDGEAQRPTYDRHFLACLGGIDFHNLSMRPITRSEIATNNSDYEGLDVYARAKERVPRLVRPIEWVGPVAVDELRFLKAHARKPVKATIVGPVTLSAHMVDEVYGDQAELALAIAGALNSEMRAMEAAGADLIQIDEPDFHGRFSLAQRVGAKAIEVAVEGLKIPVVVHVCYGYAFVNRVKTVNPMYSEVLELVADTPVAGMSIEYEQPGHTAELLRHCGNKHVIVGLIDMSKTDIETPQRVETRLREALEFVAPERLHASTDCGMWFLPRPVAFGKITSLVEGTARVRRSVR